MLYVYINSAKVRAQFEDENYQETPVRCLLNTRTLVWEVRLSTYDADIRDNYIKEVNQNSPGAASETKGD